MRDALQADLTFCTTGCYSTGLLPLKARNMKLTSKVAFLFVLLSFATVAFAQAPPFSADMVMTMDAQTTAAMQKMGMPANQTMKIYVSGLKMRVDSGAGQMQNIMISDFAPEGKTYMISPASKSYMEMKNDSKQAGGSAQVAAYLKWGGDICGIGDQYTSCKKADTSSVDGRPCQNYQVVKKSGSEETLCVDPKLHFPLRTINKSSTTEMKNVKEGAQSSSLFTLPSGLTKTEMKMGR